MKNKQQIFFNAAKEVSKLSNHPRAKLGCVVVEHGRIISSGHNSFTKTHPLQKKLDKIRFDEDSTAKVHAEVAALLPLINSRIDLNKASIYVYRAYKNGELACARPCAGCMSLIKQCGIKKVYYSTSDGYAVEDLKM